MKGEWPLVFFLWGASALTVATCGPGERTREPEPGRRSPVVAAEPPPLETVTLDEEAVVPLQEEPGSARRPVGVPCAWARIWEEPRNTKPLAVGGMVKPPRKIVDVAPALPYRKDPPAGTPVLEAVIAPDGAVLEVKILQSFDPPWLEADQALVEAIRQWKYEPTVLDGKAISVCTKITLNINWPELPGNSSAR